MQLPWMAAKIVLRPVAELHPHAGNARMHSVEQLDQIKASMLAFGFTNPLLVDEDGVLIAGHGRLDAALALGIAKVPVIILRHLSPAQKEALRLADNRIAENATWDQALLRDALAGLQAAGEVDLLAIGFSQDEIGAILAAADEAVTEGDARDEPEDGDATAHGEPAAPADEDEADDPADAEPEPPRAAVTRPGDLWLLGEHRLLCGDSTDATCVARAMSGERAVLLFTSPPYGSQRNYTTGGIADWDALMRGVFQHAGDVLTDDGQVLVNLGLIPDNVVRITRHKERGIETEHPAVFPVKLPAFLMETYANEGDLVFEPFCGSGTTLLAGQRTGRHVRAIELAPAYVDLAIARWRQNHPDLPVTLDDDGRDYDVVAAERTRTMETSDAA